MGQTRAFVDAAAEGALLARFPQDALNLLEEMAMNSYQWPSERSNVQRVAEISDSDPIKTLTAQVAALTTQLRVFTKGPEAGTSTGSEALLYPMEEVNYVNNRNFNNFRNNSNPTHYHPGLRNHENFSYANTKNVLQPPPGFNTSSGGGNGEGKSSLEDTLTSFINQSNAFMNETRSHIAKQDFRMDKLEQQVTSSIKNLETQMGQLAAIVGSQHQKGQFPSNTEVNPREHCNVIHVWGGKENEESENADIGVTSESRTTRVSMHDQVVCVAEPTIQIQGNDRNDAQGNMKVKGGTEQQIDKQKRAKKRESYPNSNLLKYNIPLPFPRLFHKTNLNNQFAKFVGMFKKLHINVPFAEAMKHMPNYVKFLGEAMSNKNKWAENGMVNLTEECSALIQRKIPQKLKDPGSFTIPCTIGDIFFDNVLCDLGSSINLMPLSVLRKLGLVEVRPSTVTLQLADRSLVHPTGILEDVLIKVDKFIFPVDFLVLDMNEDCDTPLILGRPFLATAEALIDVKKGELTLQVDDERISFSVFRNMKGHDDLNGCKTKTIANFCTQANSLNNCVHFKDNMQGLSMKEKKRHKKPEVEPRACTYHSHDEEENIWIVDEHEKPPLVMTKGGVNPSERDWHGKLHNEVTSLISQRS